MSVSLLLHLLCALLVHAEDHLTYDQVALEGRGRNDDGQWHYFVTRGPLGVEVSEREHEILVALFNLRGAFRTGAELQIEMQKQAELGVFGTYVIDRDEPRVSEIDALNERLRARLGKPLIVTAENGFRLLAQKPAIWFSDSGRVFRYRGVHFTLPGRPMEVVRTLWHHGPTLTYEQMREALRLSRTSRLLLRWIESLNRRTMIDTGAGLIDVDTTARTITLAPRELPPPARARTVTYRDQAVDLDATEARVWEAFALDRHEPGATLRVGEPELSRVDASFTRFLQILMLIDRKVTAAAGAHLLNAVQMPSGTWWSRGRHEFEHGGWSEAEARSRCADNLN